MNQPSKNLPLGHFLALLTISIWGTTFISTKLLLTHFTPIEILFYRFVIGWIALIFAHFKLFKWTSLKRELLFAASGLCGVTLYFLLENIALTYTLASNVGVIISIAPMFTILFSQFFSTGEKITKNFFIGFTTAMIGVIIINFNGSKVLNLNPLGDILAVLAALVWALYAVLTKKISTWGYNTIQTTRRTFTYGLLFMIPSLFILPGNWDLSLLTDTSNLLHLLFLGLGASALCFVTWNMAVKLIGAVKTSTYIYLVPAITVVTSALFLGEPLSFLLLLGTSLTIGGLVISEKLN